LAPSSKKLYRIVLDKFGTLHGHRMVHDMPRAKVATYVYAIGAEHPSMANLARSVLRKFLAHAVRSGYRTDNPTNEIDRYKGGTRHTWTEAELATYERQWPLGTRERLAYALLLYTGQRGGDVVNMRRADISFKRLPGCSCAAQHRCHRRRRGNGAAKSRLCRNRGLSYGSRFP
jgi:site-specific recombinase XerD